MSRPPPRDAPRADHEAYAREHDLFWIPCPRCGKPFGGHEQLPGHTLPWKFVFLSDGSISVLAGQGTCCPRPPGGDPLTERQIADAWMLTDMRYEDARSRGLLDMIGWK